MFDLLISFSDTYRCIFRGKLMSVCTTVFSCSNWRSITADKNGPGHAHLVLLAEDAVNIYNRTAKRKSPLAVLAILVCCVTFLASCVLHSACL